MPRQNQSRPIHLGVFLAALASLWSASQARAEDAPGGYAPGGQAPAPAFEPPAYYLLEDGARLRDSQGRPLSFPDPISAAIALERRAQASPGVPHGIELTSRWTLTYPPSEPAPKPDVFDPAALGPADVRWGPCGQDNAPTPPEGLDQATLPRGKHCLDLDVPVASIERMEWWYQGKLLGTERIWPYTHPWSLGSAAPGAHAVEVRVFSYPDTEVARFSVPFQIEAPDQAALRDATLRWDPPAERANGDPLSPAELWGYVVMISPSGEGGAEPQVLDIPGASTTRAAIAFPSWPSAPTAAAPAPPTPSPET